MVQKMQVLFEDDLDGSVAEGTVNFSLDGSDYEIDLNTAHAEDLRNVFAPYLAVARKITFSRPVKPGRAKVTRSPRTGPSSTEVREWAKALGIEVNDRGRIPTDLIARFEESKKVPQVEFKPEPAPEGNGKPASRRASSRASSRKNKATE